MKKKKNSYVYANGGQVGSVIGTTAGLAAGLLIPGAQPFIPQLMSAGGTLGNATGNILDKPVTDPLSVQQQYARTTPFGYANGGQVFHPVINAEKNELVVKKGMIKKDLQGLPKHPVDGSLDPNGNIQAQTDDVVIPAYMRKEYMYGDIDKRKDLEKKVIKDQKSDKKFAQGGKVPFDPFSTTDLQRDTLESFVPNNMPYVVGSSNITAQNLPSTPETNKNIVPVNMASKSSYIGFPQDQPNFKGTSAMAIEPRVIEPGASFGDVAKMALPYVDNVANAVLTAMTPKIPKPELRPFVQLDKRLNIKPQITDLEATRRATMEDIAQRTGSSSVYRANAGNVFAKAQEEKNRLYAMKGNYEKEVSNKERLLNNEIDNQNRGTMNTFRQQEMLRKNDINEAISENFADASLNAQGQIKDKNLTSADIVKTAMIYGAYNTNGVLDRAKVQELLASSNMLTAQERRHLEQLLQATR
jgi:hypothetical protein